MLQGVGLASLAHSLFVNGSVSLFVVILAELVDMVAVTKAEAA